MPGTCCSVVGCFALSTKNRGLSFFAIKRPDPDWTAKLVTAVNRMDKGFNKNTLNRAKICSRHFEKECIEIMGDGDELFSRRVLKNGALPTLFMPQRSCQTRKPPPRRVIVKHPAPEINKVSQPVPEINMVGEPAPEIKKTLIAQYQDALQELGMESWVVKKTSNSDFDIMLIKDFVVLQCLKVRDENTTFYVNGMPKHLIPSVPSEPKCQLQLLDKLFVTVCEGITDPRLVQVANLLGKDHCTNYIYDKDQDKTQVTVRHKQCTGVGDNILCSRCRDTQSILKKRAMRKEKSENCPTIKPRTPLSMLPNKRLVNAVKIERARANTFEQQLKKLGINTTIMEQEFLGETKDSKFKQIKFAEHNYAKKEMDINTMDAVQVSLGEACISNNNDSELLLQACEGQRYVKNETANQVITVCRSVGSQKHASFNGQENDKHEFKCKFCNKLFTSKYGFVSHVKRHMGKKPYQCKLCGKFYSSLNVLRVHIRTHTREKPYLCAVCGNSFPTASHMLIHMRLHTGERPYKCKFCEKSFRLKRCLTVHIRCHTGEKPFKCTVCEKSFRQASNFHRHMRIHTGEKPFKCTVCEKSFSRKISLHMHMRRHTGEMPFMCSVCGETFISNKTLVNHTRKHTGETPYKCNVCNKAFSSSYYVEMHMRTHTGEKPYQCQICEKAFSCRTQLKVHTRFHTREKPYKCKVCENSFRQHAHLKRHMRTHTGEKPYKCTVCKRAFSGSTDLAVHMRSHTGERPFICSLCGETFTSNRTLVNHTRKHTGEKPYMCTVCGSCFPQLCGLKTHMKIHDVIQS